MAAGPVAHRAGLLQSPALPLVLQHSSVHTDLQAVLQLYCTSNAMQAAVLQHCRGLLHVSFAVPRSMQRTQRFAAWIVKHGQLMGCLRILPGKHHTWPQLEMYGLTTEEAWDKLAAAQLCIAAALTQLQLQGNQGGVQLHTLQLLPVGTSAQALLETLPSSKLLSLNMGGGLCKPTTVNSSSITALSQLQSLAGGAVLKAEQLLEVLPALTALTQLDIGGLLTADDYEELQTRLPMQLKALEISCTYGPPQLQLALLSALTSLCAIGTDTEVRLPPQLLKLDVGTGQQLQAILGCQHLQQLSICRSKADATELSMLSSLTGLTDLRLLYGHTAQPPIAAQAAAAAWPLLAGKLRSLEIEGLLPWDLQAASVLHIQQLSRLTCLRVSCWNMAQATAVALPVTPAAFAGVLAALTQLKTLELCVDPTGYLVLQDLSAAAVAAAADAAGAAAGGDGGGHQPSAVMLPVTTAIAGLPHLQSLELKCPGLGILAVEPLTALSKLSRLTISGRHCDDAGCISLALSLTGLRRLSLGGNAFFGDLSLLAISKALTQLTRLKLNYCSSVSEVGVMHLTRLRGLRVLWAQGAEQISRQVVVRVLQHTARESL